VVAVLSRDGGCGQYRVKVDPPSTAGEVTVYGAEIEPEE
jgi:hypothetical protein